MGSCLRKMDSFGTNLNVNYGGQELFSTKRGGTITLLAYSFVLYLLFGSLINKLWLQEDPSIETYVINERPEKVFNLREHFSNVFMYIFERDQNGFSRNKIPELDPRAGNLSIMHHYYDGLDLPGSIKSVKLEAAPCLREDTTVFGYET